MNRRHAVALLVGALASPALAQDHSHQHGHDGAAGGGQAHRALVEAASDCIKTGEACLAHCFASFAAGDTTLAACARSVDTMLSVCATLQKLAAAGSPHLPALARVALAVCDECEAECRKHAEHHATCKACAEACGACARECRSV
jgi:Cys-rich four helix bundle protein (predicted Tat secretion target)